MKYVIETQFCLCLIYRNIGPRVVSLTVLDTNTKSLFSDRIYLPTYAVIT